MVNVGEKNSERVRNHPSAQKGYIAQLILVADLALKLPIVLGSSRIWC